MSSGNAGDNEYEVNINLTALLDVLTNLLFFLMLGFASQQVNIEVPAGIVLPDSHAVGHLEKDIGLEISSHVIAVDHQPIARVSQNAVIGTLNVNARIEPLYLRLTRIKRLRQQLHAENNDVLRVFCDKAVPYVLLHQVLNTAAQAGYPKFRMIGLVDS